MPKYAAKNEFSKVGGMSIPYLILSLHSLIVKKVWYGKKHQEYCPYENMVQNWTFHYYLNCENTITKNVQITNLYLNVFSSIVYFENLCVNIYLFLSFNREDLIKFQGRFD